jgi:hypothetical protein
MNKKTGLGSWQYMGMNIVIIYYIHTKCSRKIGGKSTEFYYF